MNRFLLILGLLLAPVAAHAQGGILLENGAATTIIVGPFLDGTDGVTTEEALTVTEWDLDICYSDATCDAITVTASAGSNDAAHVANGMYSLEIAAADADTNGSGHIIITHATPATFVPVYHQIFIAPTSVFDTLTTDGFTTVTGLWSELTSVDHGAGSIGEAIGDNLDTPISRLLISTGTAQAGTASTIQLAAAETFADSELIHTSVLLSGGTGAGQCRPITAYTSSTDTASVSPNWTTNPSSDSVYTITTGCHADGNLLTAIDLPNQTMDITGNLSGSVGSVGTDGIDAAALAADAVDEIWDEAIAELTTTPAAAGTMRQILAFIYMCERNQVTVSATLMTCSNDAGTVVFQQSLSDNGTTFTQGEAVDP